MTEVTLTELLALDEKTETRRVSHHEKDFDRKGKLNAWQCESCKGYFVSRDRDAGVTPYILFCKDEKLGGGLGCGGEMTSKFYRIAQDDPWPVSHKWIRPKTEEELADALEHDDEYHQYSDHLRRGGLHLVRITNGDGGPVETATQRDQRRLNEMILKHRSGGFPGPPTYA